MSLIKNYPLSRFDHLLIFNGFKKSKASALEKPFVKAIFEQYLGDKNFLLAHTSKQKPYLVSPSPFFFNLSHSHEVLAIFISSHSHVGVDIEKMVKPRGFAKIAKKYCFSKESTIDLRSFYHEWTAKESFIKKNGLTIANYMKGIKVDLIKDKAWFYGLPEHRLEYFNFEDYICCTCKVIESDTVVLRASFGDMEWIQKIPDRHY